MQLLVGSSAGIILSSAGGVSSGMIWTAFSNAFGFFQAPTEPPEKLPKKSFKTLEKCASCYIFSLFDIFVTERVQIGKFINGGVSTAGGGTGRATRAFIKKSPNLAQTLVS